MKRESFSSSGLRLITNDDVGGNASNAIAATARKMVRIVAPSSSRNGSDCCSVVAIDWTKTAMPRMATHADGREQHSQFSPRPPSAEERYRVGRQLSGLGLITYYWD